MPHVNITLKKCIFLALALVFPSFAMSQIAINAPVNPGTTLSVTGTTGATVNVFVVPHTDPGIAGRICSQTDIPNWPATQEKDFSLKSANPENQTLANPLSVGDLVCAMTNSPAPVTQNRFSNTVTVTAPVDDIEFVGTPTAGANALEISLNTNATVTVYQLKDGYKPATNTCQPADVPTHGTAVTIGIAASPGTKTLAGSPDPQFIGVSSKLAAGAQLCLYAVPPATAAVPNPVAFYSKIVTVTAPAPSAVASKPAFGGPAVGGRASLMVSGESGDTLTIYQFDSDFQPAKPTDPCDSYIATSGTALSQTQSGKNTTTTAGMLSDPPQTITLSEPLVAGTLLCLAQTKKDGPTVYSAFQTVTDPSSHGRAIFDFTAGSIISNQQNTSSSSASVYLDLGFIFDLARAGGKPIPQAIKKDASGKEVLDTYGNKIIIPAKPYLAWKPGFEDFIDLRLTQVPVSTSTTTTSSTTSTPSVQTILSSQQSAVINGGFVIPWRLTRWNKSTSSFIFAPVAKAGFDTLLNPSISGATASTTTTASAIPRPQAATTANAIVQPTFDSLYWFHSYGLRLGWSKFPASTDEAPKSIAQLDMTTGWFSNLPSNLCLPSKAPATTTTTAPTGTTCYLTTKTTTNGVTTSKYALDTSRTLIPRVRIDGFVKIPNYPFVIGVDANLAQYAFGTHVNKVDPLSKPGNDVRIYFGVTVDPLTVFKKIGLP